MTKQELLQQVFHQYQEAHGGIPHGTDVVVAWAVKNGLLELPDIDPAAVLADDMAQALRNEYATDPATGRRYRKNHARRVTRRGSQGDGPEAWRRMWGMFMYKSAEFLAHYHRRSNVESTFSMIKRKFGGSLRSRGFTAQVNELLCKVLCHNLVVLVHAMYELGVDPHLRGSHV